MNARPRAMLRASRSRRISEYKPRIRSISVLTTVDEVRAIRKDLFKKDASVGFVPTMGALHDGSFFFFFFPPEPRARRSRATPGHLSLVRASTSSNDVTFASIFVNAAQFAPHEDFGKYPRQTQTDVDLLERERVDFVFVPPQSELYPGSKEGDTSTSVQRTFVVPMGVDDLPSEGAARKGFFTGVATVVAKLFNIVQPTKAYFGQKDGLQAIVLKQMVRELNFPTEVVVSETTREPDGLALSSRNVYLSAEQRTEAPQLYAALRTMSDLVERGESTCGEVKAIGHDALNSETWSIEYVSLSDGANGDELHDDVVATKPMMISAAVKFNDSTVRILDNVLLE